jgi:hypothetical protein
MSRNRNAWRALALIAMPIAISCGRGPSDRPTAHQVLMSYLGRAASATSVGDSELVVTEIEWNRRPLSGKERGALAAIDVSRIRQHWPDPRLRRVTVVFERPRRFGPIVFGRSDTALVFNVANRADGAP